MAVLLPLLFIACGDEEETPEATPPPSPFELRLSADEVEFDALGASHRLAAEVLDEEGQPLADPPAIEWSSSAPSVATVDESGEIVAVSQGKTVIEARVGELTATADVQVAQVPRSARLLPEQLHFDAIGASRRLDFAAWDRNEHPVTGLPLVWTSDDEEVATVDVEGVVTARGPGSAVIETRVEGSDTAAEVQVVVAPEAMRLVFDDLPAFVVQQPTELVVRVVDREGHPVESATHKIKLSLGESVPGAHLEGTRVANAVAGRATFDDLRIDRSGTQFTLIAEADGLLPAESPVSPSRPAPRPASLSAPSLQ